MVVGEALTHRLAEQLGFWFSDANLRKDKFLLRQTGAVGTGGVDLRTLASFNRIKALTNCPERLLSASNRRGQGQL